MEHPRIIFNHDGGVVTSRKTCPPGGFPVGPREYQEAALRPFRGTQVDTLFWCIGTDVFNLPLRSGQRLGEGLPEDVTRITKLVEQQDDLLQFRRLWAEGTDPLALVAEEARRQGLQIYASFRMNDYHFVYWKDWFGEDCALHWCRFNREHPELTIDGGRSPLDFAHQEVRDYRLAQIEEVCDRYAIDGIELDFFRHPRYFKPPAAEKAPVQRFGPGREGRVVDLLPQATLVLQARTQLGNDLVQFTIGKVGRRPDLQRVSHEPGGDGLFPALAANNLDLHVAPFSLRGLGHQDVWQSAGPQAGRIWAAQSPPPGTEIPSRASSDLTRDNRGTRNPFKPGGEDSSRPGIGTVGTRAQPKSRATATQAKVNAPY